MKLSCIIKTVPQQQLAHSRQLSLWFNFTKMGGMGKFYFLMVSLLLAIPASLYAVAPGNALSFNGSTYVLLPSTYSNINFSNTSNFTISMWFKGNNLLYKQNSGGGGQGEILLTAPSTSGGPMQFGFGSGDPLGWEWLSPTQPVTTSIWNHVAVTKSGTTLSLYLNGQLDKSMTTTRIPTPTTGSLNIGADVNTPQFNGLIDELQIWNTALTQSQIQAKMVTTLSGGESGLVAYYNFDQSSGTTLPDSTADVYHGTIIGTATWVPSTWNVPAVTTGSASAITTTTASVGGNVIYGGIAAVTARGICYATTATPTSPCVTTGTGTGSYTSSLTGLTPGTTYYTRAYATNSEGTTYGSDVTFTTRYIPVIAQGTSVSVTMSEDGSPTAWTSPTITATDGNGDTLTWTLATAATHGTATVSGTGASPTLTYSPSANYNGTDSFVVQVADVDGAATITVTVIIQAVNDAPVANAASFTTNEDIAFSNTLIASDIETSPLTYILVADGLTGTATINASTGAFTYTPTANLSGVDSFTFKASDGGLNSNTATVTVTITSVNDIPTFTASNPPAVRRNSGPQTLTNWATFTPGPNETDTVLTYLVSNVTNPSLFTVLPNIDNSGTLTYTLGNQAGGANFNVQVRDTGGTANGGIDLSTATTFTIRVNQDIQTINFTPLTAMTLGDLPQTLIATATSGLPVTFTSLTPSICGVSGNQLTIVNTGTCTVMANQPGDVNYQAAPPVSQETNISSVIQHTLNLTLAGTGQGSVTSDPVGLECSPTTSICTLTVEGGPRWVYLTATPATGSNFISWGGDPACTNDGLGKVFLLQDTACTATFDLKFYTLTVERNVPGATVTGEGLDCQETPQGFLNLADSKNSGCQATYPHGATVKLTATAPPKWDFLGWEGSCDPQGQVTLTQDRVCRAKFGSDPNIPNAGDGNGDGVLDARQENVMSLPDKVAGDYITLVVNPECVVAEGSTLLAEDLDDYDPNHPAPQGLMYFEIRCSQTTVTMYFHGVTRVPRNAELLKYGPTIPGDENTVGWYKLPNVQFGLAIVGGKPVATVTYTLTDGQLGDNTGVDGKIVDPVGLGGR